MIDHKTLIEAIERSDCLLPAIKGYNEYLNFPGVIVCETPSNHALANKAMNARLSGEDAGAAISQVCAYFDSKKKPFSWIVGPNTTPADLGRLLLACGFEKQLGADGMYLPDLTLRIDGNSEVTIRELPPGDHEAAVEIMAVGFGMPTDVSRFFHEMIALSFPKVRSRAYLAYLDGVSKPVACAYIAYYPDRPIALLCGGATLPGYRGRGIYRAMLAYRLSDVVRDGVEAVIVLADQRTSAPICRKLGFKKLCEVDFYVWDGQR
ncbi:MAG: GNAT family N-acetyltransferase [Candidatus Zixiibacteriota bacterium]